MFIVTTIFYQFTEGIGNCQQCYDEQTAYELDTCFQTTDDFGDGVYAKASMLNNESLSVGFFELSDSNCSVVLQDWTYDLDVCYEWGII